PLRNAVGASYGLYSNLATPLPVRLPDDQDRPHELDLPSEATAEAWADELELEGAEPLLFYDHPHFGRYPAAVSRAYGRGRVTYVGTLPDVALGRALATWVLRRSGITPLGDGLPEPVRVSRARAVDGTRLWFVSNWSFEPRALTGLEVSGTELFSGDRCSPESGLTLGAWDVRVVREDAGGA
ncbi:MAG TPA: Beta-galactosidase C-terminal domain, partial [Actinopolymorphaceae bacterium]